MIFTGDRLDKCAISFTPVDEIEQPVGFDSAHAFECECIVEWLTTHRSSNPMTGESIPPATPVASILRPLIIREGLDAHVVETQAALDRSGMTVGGETADVIPVHWMVKFGWDTWFAICFTLVNFSGGYSIMNILLLCCIVRLIKRHYSIMHREILVVCFCCSAAFALVGKFYNIFSPAATTSMFFRLLNVEIFSAKVSLDIATTMFNANFH
jgi:hypothetical protein